jgi:hypothetical protein
MHIISAFMIPSNNSNSIHIYVVKTLFYQVGIVCYYYSEFPTLASQIPYFHVPDTTEDENQDGCHMVVCVHGLDGRSSFLLHCYLFIHLQNFKSLPRLMKIIQNFSSFTSTA